MDKDELHHQVENVWSKAIEARRLMGFLMSDLESGLDEKRGKIDPNGHLITLCFQSEGNEDTKWLASHAWRAAKDTEDLMLKVLEAFDD